ncbi:MAG: lamin tail domain-containing protein [Planctomycetes bacterium]|nr:lamin tail domain-containing protein [Planctomycetota bacterium]
MRMMSFVLIGALSIIACGCVTAPPPKLPDSPVRITEVHFFPAPTQGDAEFVEITNVSAKPVDLSGWEVDGIGNMKLPAGTVIPAGGSIVLGKSVFAVEKLAGGKVSVPATFSGKLKNEGETIRVLDRQGRVADEMAFGPTTEGFAGASATGFSLQRSEGPSSVAWKAAKPTPGKTR